jgi:dTDP-glucose 4,6-dehydratase
MITNAICNLTVPLYGDGKNVRDWIHTEDHCRAIDLVLNKGKVGETYLVGANSERKNIEVLKLILKFLDKPESLITYVKDRPGHDRRYAIDSTKISTELGWKPDRNFEDWLRDVVMWYKDNQWWWRPLKKRAESIYK